jgi:hypothetical protein
MTQMRGNSLIYFPEIRYISRDCEGRDCGLDIPRESNGFKQVVILALTFPHSHFSSSRPQHLFVSKTQSSRRVTKSRTLPSPCTCHGGHFLLKLNRSINYCQVDNPSGISQVLFPTKQQVDNPSGASKVSFVTKQQLNPMNMEKPPL